MTHRFYEGNCPSQYFGSSTKVSCLIFGGLCGSSNSQEMSQKMLNIVKMPKIYWSGDSKTS